jgi:hypothetical protein
MAGSGYNQSTEQITPTLYRVIIDTSSSSNYPTTAGSPSTGNGGVWPYDWTNPIYTNASSLTASQATYLAQGNLRWLAIMDSLDNVADCRIENVTIAAVNGSGLTTDATNQPTTITFTIAFDRDEFVLGEWNNYLKSIGQSASGTYTNSDGVSGNTAYVGIGGTAVTTVSIALRDIITSAITKGGTTGSSRSYRVYSPTLIGDSQVKVTITQPSTPSTVFGTVSASQISGTALFSGSPI